MTEVPQIVILRSETVDSSQIDVVYATITDGKTDYWTGVFGHPRMYHAGHKWERCWRDQNCPRATED